MSQHWAQQQERGSLFALKLTSIIIKYAPIFIIKIVVFIVTFYFYVTGKKARQAISQYQQNLTDYNHQIKLPNCPVLKQFLCFAGSLVDRFLVWQGKITYQDLIIEDPDNLYTQMNSSEKGQLLIGSHFGNLEICRALVTHGQHKNFKLNVLVHHKNAVNFNKALHQSGASQLSLIEIQDLNVQTMLLLQQKIEQGEWLAIAADRIPIKGNKQLTMNFLGKKADFPLGVWILAALLKTPINTIFCVKEKNQYHLKLNKLSAPIKAKGEKRMVMIEQLIHKYIKSLEQACFKNPLQWFNFYNFWRNK